MLLHTTVSLFKNSKIFISKYSFCIIAGFQRFNKANISDENSGTQKLVIWQIWIKMRFSSEWNLMRSLSNMLLFVRFCVEFEKIM